MKKIISIISILFLSTTLFGGLFEGFENPNGMPGLLSIKYSHVIPSTGWHGANDIGSFDLEYNYTPYFLDVKLPLTNYLTIGGGVFPITSTHPTFNYNPDGNGHSFYDGSFIVFINQYRYDIELHLPIYKLWKNN